MRFPVSFSQQRLWFLDRLEPERAVYNVPLAMRLRGALDVGALSSALNLLIERHEALRTSFSLLDGTVAQVIGPPWQLTLTPVDLRGLADREARAAALVSEQATLPFDLSAGPLMRAALVALGDEDHVLILTVHHIIADAWSLRASAGSPALGCPPR